MQRLVLFEETVVTMSVRDSHYTPDFNITSEDGLKFAFAITAYDSNREPIDDPRYGRVVAKIVSWGQDTAQAVDVNGGILSLHTCT